MRGTCHEHENRQSSWPRLPAATFQIEALIVVLALTLAFAGCEGSKTDSVAGNRAAQDPNHPELFNLRPEQMSHVQVVTIQPTALTRTLRLTGAVAYNNFRTTPVITQVSGPVSRVLVVPGQKVRQGQPMLYVASPDYSQLRTNYLKAKDAYSLARKNLYPGAGPVSAPRHRSERSGAGRIRRSAGGRRPGIGGSCLESDGRHRP